MSVSTREVNKIPQDLRGVDASKNQVSRLARRLDEHVEVGHNRWIEKRYPDPMINVLFEKVRYDRKCSPMRCW